MQREVSTATETSSFCANTESVSKIRDLFLILIEIDQEQQEGTHESENN